MPKGIVKDRAFYSRIGKKGGINNREKHKDDPDHFSTIGRAGGYKLLETRGKEHFSMIGKIPSKTNRQRGQHNV